MYSANGLQADRILHPYKGFSIIQNVLLFHSAAANVTRHSCSLAHACEDIVTFSVNYCYCVNEKP